MGSNESSEQIKQIPYEKKMHKLNGKFREEKLAKIWNSSSVHKDLKAFSRIGKYLNNKKPFSIPKDNLDRVCFLVINTYNRKTYQLGSGPINDGYMIGKFHYNRGYQIYFLHNPSKSQFVSFTAFFLKNTKKSLTVFYEGRSTTLVGTEGDVIQGQSDALVFDLNYLKNEEMGQLLADNSNEQCKVVLINHCCNGPSIWCLDLPCFKKFDLSPNIISISTVSILPKEDPNSNKKCEKKENNTDGIFIFFLLKCINKNPSITPNQIAGEINTELNKHDLSLYYYSTTSNLDSKPLFL